MSTVTNRQHARTAPVETPARSPARKGSATAGNTMRSSLFSPGAAWRRRSHALRSSGLFGPLAVLMTVLVLLGVSSVFVLLGAEPRELIYIIQISLLFAGVVLIGVILMRIQRRLMEPLAHLRNWAMRMRGGNLSARVPVPERGELAELATDINSLGDELKKLSREMDQEVRKQTERIELKSRSLEILYDVAASINTSRDLDDLLKRFLLTLTGVTNARAATVRLLTDDNRMRLVASLGMPEEMSEKEEYVAVDRCMCGQAVRGGELLSKNNVRQCGQFAGCPFFEDDDTEMIAVPLQYRGKNLGVYNLFVTKPGLVGREDIKDLLISIGRHLGMAIEKARLDEESKRLSILRERSMLSHELHDSLAQTLASLRFQIRGLEETVQRTGDDAAEREVQQIKSALDEAYTELRELLAHFRAPFDERGLVAAIENVVDRFRKSSDMLIFFQNQWKDLKLSSILEMQVLRIIQEALTNIRKHSQAHTVRVLLRTAEDGTRVVLVEDDGIGIGEPVLDGKPGEHVGLAIMQERARRLGGELMIESEPGEGTRIQLTFQVARSAQNSVL